MSIRICTVKHMPLNIMTGKDAREHAVKENKKYIVYDAFGSELKESIECLKINKIYTIFSISDGFDNYNLYVQTKADKSTLRKILEYIIGFFKSRNPTLINQLNDKAIDDINAQLSKLKSEEIVDGTYYIDFIGYDKSLDGIEEYLKKNIKKCFDFNKERKYEKSYSTLKKSYDFLYSKDKLIAKKLFDNAIINEKYTNYEGETKNLSLFDCFTLKNNENKDVTIEDAVERIFEGKNYKDL